MTVVLQLCKRTVFAYEGVQRRAGLVVPVEVEGFPSVHALTIARRFTRLPRIVRGERGAPVGQVEFPLETHALR